MKRFCLTLLVLTLPACASAQTPAAHDGPHAVHAERGTRIHVSATGSVTRAPEQAVLHLAVETEAATARDAARDNAARMDRVVRAMAGLDIPQERVQTVGYDMSPVYEQSQDRRGTPRIVGYRVMNTLTVTVDGAERAGAVIDAALDAGANRVHGLYFQLRDPLGARLEALALAVERARQEAATLAAAAGLELGDPVSMSSGSGAGPGPVMGMRMAAGEAAPTPVQPGQLEMRESVSIEYRAAP